MANPEHLEILKRGVEVWNRWRDANDYLDANLSGANLTGENLIDANFTNTDLSGANLSRADLSDVILTRTDLRGANICGARLIGALLRTANLRGADLSNAKLMVATLKRTKLDDVDFSGASMAYTIISDVNLKGAKNLESVKHLGPSSVGIDTIFKSHGNIPERFLRGCGMPEEFIIQIPALIAAIQPIQFYSCFISYSSKNEEFAKRLYADLQNEGVRCWFAPEDMKIGDKLRVRIDESIRLYDKLLLVLSGDSVASEWVEKEVETALEKEREQGNVELFPVRLDDSVLEIKTGWAADIKRTRHIGDFREWKNHDSYRKAFERLMRDLKAEARR